MVRSSKASRRRKIRSKPLENIDLVDVDPRSLSVEEIAAYRRYHWVGDKPGVPHASDLNARLEKGIELPEKNPGNFLRFQRKLGQGGGGIVYKVLDTRDRVVKAIKIAHSTDLDELKTEIAIHAATNHANIVHFEESFKFEDSIWILMELCDYGSLFDLIENSDGRWDEVHIAYVLVQCFFALASMHRQNFLHRDIKSDNIFLSKSGNVKLADFGWAVGLTKEEPKRTEAVGTPHWMAPELILQKEYGEKVDIWSMGITAIEMAEASPPFMDKTHARAQLIIATGSEKCGLAMPYERSEEFGNFLKATLNHDETLRPSAEDLLLNDEFLGKASNRKEFAKFIKTANKS